MSKSHVGQQIKSLKLKARTELNEREELTSDILLTFRRLIGEIEGLQCPMDDKFLLRFLRARKFNVERAVKLLKQYYEMRKDLPDLFQNLTPKCLSSSYEKRLQVVLRGRDAQGRHVFVFRAGDWDPREVNLDEVFRCNFLCLEEMTSTVETQINGVVAIVDFNGFSLYQARQFSPKHAQRMVQIIQDSFPCRFQEFHLVNQPFLFNMLFAMVKPFLSEKIRRRIQIHGNDYKSLHKFVQPEILPSFLGGQVTNWDKDWSEFNKKMLNKDDYYKDLCTYGFETVDFTGNIPNRPTSDSTCSTFKGRPEPTSTCQLIL